MSKPFPSVARCHIVGGQKLPLETGGGGAICGEVERAIISQSPEARFTVEISVLSPSRLSALLVVDGQRLPTQQFAVMDRNLSDGAIKQFASSLAAVVAKAVKS